VSVTLSSPYKVLATKYRPVTFADMIGQEVLVKTLGNAIASNRIANAFLLTGIRGVGKTTTARIISRALNCTAPDGKGGPTMTPCGTCANCTAITMSRHPDILEIDAASRTGVDDMREIIDNVSYAPGMARFKIYIIDEVHMLSKSAFNALLKTLEEPPPHVKFIFATTEIRKIPVTILSRCQRFDLKRIDLATLTAHLRHVITQENIQADDESLNLIAKAAEGSVRDALSLLDQAIVHSNDRISSETVAAMMGVGDRAHVIALFESIASGQTAQALAMLETMYRNSAAVIQIFQDLLEVVYLVTKMKAAPGAAVPGFLTTQHTAHLQQLAQGLELSYLTRCWQLILQGLDEIAKAPVDIVAADMLVIKLTYMSDLPSPGKIIRQLQEQTAATSHGTTPSPASLPRMNPASALAPDIDQLAASQSAALVLPLNFEETVALFKANGELLLYSWLLNECSLVAFQPGKIDFHLSDAVPANFTQRVSECLYQWTNQRWLIAISREKGSATLYQQQEAEKERLKTDLAQHPDIARVLALFPGSVVSRVE